MYHRKHERRHSFDLSSINGMENTDHHGNQRSYDMDFKSRRVRFNEDFAAKNKKRSRSAEKNDTRHREMSVQEITARLKESYENIEKGLTALQKVYEDLSRSKAALKYSEYKSPQKVSVSQIDFLLREVEALGESLKKSGLQKRKYLEELSKLQASLHEDRMKIESTVASQDRASSFSNSGGGSGVDNSRRIFRQRMMDETTKVTRDQQELITKLKHDNEYLWKILHEIQHHLEEEEISDQGSLNSSEGEQYVNSTTGERVQQLDKFYGDNPHLPRVPLELPSIKCDLQITSNPSRRPGDVKEDRSGSETSNYSSNYSTGSCQEKYISEKVKSLIKQTENIQKMIPNVFSRSSNNQLSDYQSENLGNYNSKRQQQKHGFDDRRESMKTNTGYSYSTKDDRLHSEHQQRSHDYDNIDSTRKSKDDSYDSRFQLDNKERMRSEDRGSRKTASDFSYILSDRHDSNDHRSKERSIRSDCYDQQRESMKTESTYSYMTNDNRIPSENEHGIRSDTKDIIRRCDDLEKRVEQCSTKNIRDRIIQQLEEIDMQLSQEETGHSKEDRHQQHHHHHHSTLTTKGNQWHPEVHKKVRGELFKCLDQMSSMEKNCSAAQEEIARLRQYIKSSSEQKEFSEKTFKREALQLRMVVDEKSKEVEVLKANMDEAIKGLKDSENLLQQIEELEKVVEEKDEELERVKHNSSKECEKLKSTLTEKTEELETLRMEMKDALESMEKLRIKTAKREEHYEKIRLGETIGAELSLLQVAITDVDRKMRILQDENLSLKQELDMKVSMLHELSVENETLSNQLYTCEQESNLLKSNLAAIKMEQNIRSFFHQDQRIKQLEQALSEKESVLNSTFKKSERAPTEEHEQVIESLLDDNEKYMEKIHEKDRVVEELRKELEKLQTTTDKRDINDLLDSIDRNTSKDPQQQTPAELQERYLQIIQRKNKTIDELRANLEAVTAEADRKLINELLSALSNKNTAAKEDNGDRDEREQGIKQELTKIQTLLSSSHREMIGKIFMLEGMLNNLQVENKILRKQLGKPTENTSNNLEEKFQRIMEENSTLRDNLNRPYPGLVQNILTQSEEVKRLHEENELLRLGLSSNKKELVDSNLRKRQRIKDLQLKLEDMEQNNGSGDKQDRLVRRRSSSVGDDYRDFPSKKHGDRHKSHDEVLEEMRNQNILLQRLEKDNQRLSQISRDQASEIARLVDEIERLQESTRAKKLLENEVRNLQDALEEMNGMGSASQQRIKELEDEIEAWRERTRTPDRTLDEGFTPDRSRLSLDQLDTKEKTKSIKLLHADYNKLKDEHDKAAEDMRRMTRLLEKEKSRVEKLEDKINDLEEEKQQLEQSLRKSERESRSVNDALKEAEWSCKDAQSAEKQAKEEIAKLRKILQDVNQQHQEDVGTNEAMGMLTDKINTLEQDKGLIEEKLDQTRQDRDRLTRELNALQAKLREERIDAVNELEQNNEQRNSEIIELNNQLDQMKTENGELQDINEQLVEQLEKIKSEVNETQFKEWLEKDAENRLALLSPDTHRSDIGLDQDERQYKKDQQRIIRKLQIENQIMKAKLLSLEEENIAATKIVSDMERGHGHLTGTLRCHLILQRNTTAKLLEGSLQQYTKDFEALQRKFTTLEEKYDRRKEKLKRRDDIWDLFTNAAATITNINTILNEGLVKVEEDLERELDENEFEDKDYKSRLWILRRRLSDVENRHRELQLRAEELNLRLDAKTTEFEVTQDELEDATRDLESRDSHLDKMKKEMDVLSKERGKLNNLMKLLKQNEDRNVGDVINENKALRDHLDPTTSQQQRSNVNTNQMSDISGRNLDLSELIAKLNERDAALNVMRKMRTDTEKENDELKRRVNFLERKLKEVTDQRDKLQKEAEYRSGYMSFARDDFGTIHMLRDDLKRLTNENAELKHDIVLKHRQIYDMSKDLHKLRIQLDLDSSQTEKKYGRKEDTLKNMVQDLAEMKADKFLLETKLKDAERRLGGKPDNKEDTGDIETIFKQKLSEKEHEIEKLKRSQSRNSNPRRSPMPSKDDTMSDITSVFDSSKSEPKNQADQKKKIQELKDENKILKEAIADKGLLDSVDYIRKIKAGEKKIKQMRVEVAHLNEDNDKKRVRIKELLNAIEELNGGKVTTGTTSKIIELVEKTKEDEMESVLEKLHRSKQEVEEWKNKAENYEKDLGQVNRSDQIGAPNEMNEHRDSLSFRDSPSGHSKGRGMILPKAPTSSTQEPFYMEMADVNSTKSPREQTDGSRKSTETSKKNPGVSKIPVSPIFKRQKPSTKLLSNNSEDIQDKSKSTSSQRKKWELPGEDKGNSTTHQTKDEKVSQLQLQIEQLTDELSIYRTNLDMNRHDTIDMLGPERLDYKIDFQISMRCMDEMKKLQNDIYKLEHENERLHENYVNLAQTVDTFNQDVNNEVQQSKKALLRRQDSFAQENVTLKSIVKEQREEINGLSDQLSELESQLSEKDSEMERLIEALQSKESEPVNEFLTMKDNILEKNAELVQNQEKLVQKNKDLTQQIHEIESLKSSLERKIENQEDLSQKLKLKSEECTKLQRKLNSMGVAKKTTELKNVKAALEQRNEEFNKLTEQLKKKTDECTKLHRKLKDSGLASKATELRNVKTELMNKTEELQQINDKLTSKIAECSKLKNALDKKKKFEKSAAKPGETEQKTDNANKDLENENSTLKEEIEKRNEIIQNMRAHIDKLKEQNRLKKHQTEEQQYKETIEKLKETLSEKEKEGDESLREAVRALEDAKEKLVVESEMRGDLMTKLQRIEKVLAEERQKNEQDQFDLITELQTVNNEFTRYKDNAQTEIKKLNAIKDEFTLYKQTTKEEIAQLNSTKQDIQTENNKLDAIKDEFNCYKEKAEKEIEELNTVKAEFTLYKETTQEEIEEISSVKDEVTSQQLKIEELNGAIGEFTLYKEKQQTEMEKLRMEIHELLSEKQKAQNEIEKLRAIKDEFTLYKKQTQTDNEDRERKLSEQKEQLESVKAEHTSYKESAETNIENLTNEITNLEKQVEKYMIHKEKNQKEAEKSQVNSTSNLTGVSEELIVPEESSTSEAVPGNPREFFAQDQPDGSNPTAEKQLFSPPGNDLEIELEILQGCNEELEQEIASLKIEIKNLEDAKLELTNDLNQTKEDLHKTLEYLRELNEKNEAMVDEHNRISQKLKMEKQEVESLQTKINEQEYQHEEETSRKELKLEHQLRRLEIENKQHTATIEQLEELIDQLENENNRKETAFEKLKRNNETNIKELEAVARDLEEEIKLRSDENDKMKINKTELQLLIGEKDNQLRQLTEINEKLEYDLKRKHNKLSRSKSIERSKSIDKQLETISEESAKESRTEEEIKEMELKIIELEASLAKWIGAASKQAGEVERLSGVVRTHNEEQNSFNSVREELEKAKEQVDLLSKQLRVSKEEIDNKNTKLHSLRNELHDKDQQYTKVLNSLNKRRDESKTFLAMQQTLRDEIDKKEDLIRKLKFKIKASDMDISMSSLNVSRDDLDHVEIALQFSDDDELDGPATSTARRKSDAIGQHQDVVVNLTNQLFSSRDRNKQLSNQLEESRRDYIAVKEEKERLENKNKRLNIDINDYKEKLTELRGIIQSSPDISIDHNGSHQVGLKTKLYASYKELREKSIEIASLQMCMEIKDDEIETLSREIERLAGDIQTRTQSAIGSQSRDTSESQSSGVCTHSDDIKVLVQELNERDRNENELQRQITDLRQHLIVKNQQSDYLQAELSKVTTRFRDIEQKLCQEDENLRQKFLHAFEDDNSDISEVTPLNSLKLYSGPIESTTGNVRDADLEPDNQTLNETFTIEEIEKDEPLLSSQGNYKERIESLEEEKMKIEQDNAYFKEQVDNLRNEIDRINRTNQQNNDALRNEMTMKDTIIQRLQTALTVLETNHSDDLGKRDSEKIFETKLHFTEKRHIVEMESLKFSLLNAKNEHLASISQRLERSFEEKVFFQSKAKQLEELLKRKNKEILKLKHKFRY